MDVHQTGDCVDPRIELLYSSETPHERRNDNLGAISNSASLENRKGVAQYKDFVDGDHATVKHLCPMSPREINEIS